MSAPLAPVTDTSESWREVVGRRHSCRGFVAEPLPEETLIEIFTLAQRTASWCNAQPWSVDLLTGRAARRLAVTLEAAYEARSPVWDVEPPVEYLGDYQDRRRGAGAALYQATGVRRHDIAGRVTQMRRNFTFFGAPHVAVLSVTADLGPYALVDLGSYLSTVLWTAEALGVAAIAQAAPARHSDLLRSALHLPAGQLVVACVALGREDPEHPANQFRTTRAHPHEVIRMHRD